MPPDALLGPLGLVFAAAGATVILWREHVKADERERQIAARALAGWEAQTAATNRLAEAVEQKTRDDAERRAQERPMIERLTQWFARRSKHRAAKATELQKQSDAVLARARRAERQAQRERLASATTKTVRALRGHHES